MESQEELLRRLSTLLEFKRMGKFILWFGGANFYYKYVELFQLGHTPRDAYKEAFKWHSRNPPKDLEDVKIKAVA